MTSSPARLSFIYKESRGTQYWLDVHLPSDDLSSLPILIYFHGGGLTSGNRSVNSSFSKWLLDDALKAGFVFISADYSLLHPSTAHNMISDVQDLFAWIANHLNTELGGKLGLMGKDIVNANKIAVAGPSAGGYLTYLSGLYGNPKPKALVPIYAGGGDLLIDFHVTPKTKPFFMNRPLVSSSKPYQSIFTTPASSPPVASSSNDPGISPRVSYAAWLFQTATFIDVLTGVRGLSKALATLNYERRTAFIDANTRNLLPSLMVDGDFPPTFLLHGTNDSVVPVEESRSMKRRLDELGVESWLWEYEGGDHGFDNTPENWEEKWEGLGKVVPFIKAKLDC